MLSSAMFVACGLAMLFAEPLLGFLFGDAYLPAVPAFILLMPAVFLFTIGSILGNFNSSISIPFVAVPYFGMMALLNFIANLYLIPLYGISGAAISSLITYGLLIPFNIYWVRVFLRRG